MNKIWKNLLFILILGVNGSVSFAQSYQEGYIITLEKDTIWGSWREHFNSMVGLHVEFKHASGESIYTARDILGYGAKNTYLRKRFTVETEDGTGGMEIKILFLNCLIKGPVSLYQNKEGKNGRDLFVYTEERGLEAVESKKEVILLDNKLYETPGLQYESVLRMVMGSCYDRTESLKKFGYSRKRIIKSVIEYHTCKGEAYQLLKENEKDENQKYVGIFPTYAEIGADSHLSDDGLGIGGIFMHSLFKSPTIFFQIEAVFFPDNQLVYLSSAPYRKTSNILIRPAVRKSVAFKRVYLFANTGLQIKFRKEHSPSLKKWHFSSDEGPVFVGLGFGYSIQPKIRIEAFGAISSSFYMNSGLTFLWKV
ncbi:MAG: hypothetical protein AAF587_22930 [Bacteroidota bacterium]